MTEEVLRGYPSDLPLHTCSPMWGVSWSLPSAGPLLGLDGAVSAPHGEGKPGSCPTTLASPLLPQARTYLAGPRARRSHRLRSSFPGSGRGPSAPPQESGPTPASGPTNRAVPVTAASNPRGSGRVPPPRLQHLSDRGPGRGRVAMRRLGFPGGKTSPISPQRCRDSGLRAA